MREHRVDLTVVKQNAMKGLHFQTVKRKFLYLVEMEYGKLVVLNGEILSRANVRTNLISKKKHGFQNFEILF